MSRGLKLCAIGALCALAVPLCQAEERLAWTGGVTQVEGSAGGGLVPWALIAGLGTKDAVGGSVFATYVTTDDFLLRTAGLSVGVQNRVEVSFAQQWFDAGRVVPGVLLEQHVLGLKVRLFGDAVFEPDRWYPQVALGAQWKRTHDYGFIPAAVGARDGDDVDVYVAATKLYFAALAGRNVVVNATLRRSRANQFGLLGFGGPRGNGANWLPEASVGVFVTEDLLLGAEYRDKPDTLAAFDEGAARDLFLAWNPDKHLTLVGAWVDLGPIAGKPRQRGAYLSVAASF